MDFGVLSSCSDPETKQRFLYGHHTIKTDDFTASTTLPNNNNKSIYQQQQQQQQQHHQMLSFASPKSEPPLFFHRNHTGYNYGNWNAGGLYGSVIGARGPFTPSQWMELEHQALIYKYINSNVPIPSNLLIPIKRAVESALFSTFSGLPFRPNTLGWGSFHLGYANSNDPEPGRCRRTDGKKWRCSRDAVPDQKYCERHINRGRHRSRKLVEAQSGASVASTNNSSKVAVMPSAAASSLGGGRGTSHSLAMSQQEQVEHVQPSAIDASAANRMFMNKDSLNSGTLDTPGLSMLSSKANRNSKDASFSIPKQQIPYYEISPVPEFGHVSSDCLLNPASESFTFMNCRSYGSTSSDIAVQETGSQHPLRHFMDEWPNNSRNSSSTVSWADSDLQSDRTQLSISIPMDNSSDHTNDKAAAALSPLRLSKEVDPFQMGLGVGSVSSEQNGMNRHANWIPISWEGSVGGPLGEVLHNTSNSNKADYKYHSSLNLMTDSWDTNNNINSPRVGSSPTGVLQKMAFGSVSNSSAGSSPRAELCSALPCNH